MSCNHPCSHPSHNSNYNIRPIRSTFSASTPGQYCMFEIVAIAMSHRLCRDERRCNYDKAGKGKHRRIRIVKLRLRHQIGVDPNVLDLGRSK